MYRQRVEASCRMRSLWQPGGCGAASPVDRRRNSAAVSAPTSSSVASDRHCPPLNGLRVYGASRQRLRRLQKQRGRERQRLAVRVDDLLRTQATRYYRDRTFDPPPQITTAEGYCLGLRFGLLVTIFLVPCGILSWFMLAFEHMLK